MDARLSDSPTAPALGLFGLAVIYGFSIVSMAFVGVLIPVAAQFTVRLGTDDAAVGGGIALFSAPSALFSFFTGGLVERFGTRNSVAGGGGLVLLGDVLGYGARSIPVFDAACVAAGIGFMVIITAAPAFIVQTGSGDFRTRALSVWSTYAPTGFSLGLLLAAPFAGGTGWHFVLILHGAIMAALLLSVFALPDAGRGSQAREQQMKPSARLRALWTVLHDLGLARLGLAFAIVNGVAYGTGLVASSYLADTYQVSMGRSATAVAASKIVAMLIAGIGMGELLTRRLNPRMLFAVAILGGLVAQFVLFWPNSGFWPASAGLGVWLIAYGCLTSICMALLPVFLRGTGHPAIGSGIVSQLTSVSSFLAARTYLTLRGSDNFLLLMLAGLFLSTVLMPIWGRAAGGRNVASLSMDPADDRVSDARRAG
jgi:predicted MFS family arabinose efflux permease